MRTFTKTFRYYYWLFISFVKKNVKQISVSFVTGFFLIFLTINYFPIINSFLFKKTIKIGVVGKYDLQTLPNEILEEISNPLLTINQKGEIIPVLINSLEISNDSKVYRLHLKPNLLWSDGKIFTSHDINYEFKGIKTKIIDDKTVEFILNQPLAIFPVYLNKPIIKSPIKGVAGLYQVQNFSLKKDQLNSITLSPNKKDLDAKVYIFYENEDKLIAAYKKGEVTKMTTSKKNFADIFANWKNTKIKKDISYGQILTLFFNNSNQILESKETRKSIAFAIPNFSDYGEKAISPIPPTSWAFSDEEKKYNYNLDKAKTMLEKNLSSSQSAQLNFYTFYDYINIAEEIKRNLEQIGIKINLRVLSYMPQDFDLFLTMWNPPQDPDQYYFWHSTQADNNLTNYKNVKVDKLLEDGRKYGDITERKKIYTEFQKTITEDLPAYFIYHPYIYTIERK